LHGISLLCSGDGCKSTSRRPRITPDEIRGRRRQFPGRWMYVDSSKLLRPGIDASVPEFHVAFLTHLRLAIHDLRGPKEAVRGLQDDAAQANRIILLTG